MVQSEVIDKYTFNDKRSSSVIARPPKITLAFYAIAPSIAYRTSNPGMKGWKSLLNAMIFKIQIPFKNYISANHEYNLAQKTEFLTFRTPVSRFQTYAALSTSLYPFNSDCEFTPCMF